MPAKVPWGQLPGLRTQAQRPAGEGLGLPIIEHEDEWYRVVWKSGKLDPRTGKFIEGSGCLSMTGELAKVAARGYRLGLNPVTILKSPAVYHDNLFAAELKASGKTLCSRCDGTGNQLKAMYQACTRCKGSGVEPSDGG